MKRLWQLLLVLIIVLAAAYYFLVDVLLKSAIEREGSRMLRAELDIASVNFSLFPLGIALRDVQATNPHQPMRNLLVVQSIASTFAIRQMFDRRIVADDVQLHGLRFNQPRLRSGAIAGLTPAPVPALVGAGLPGLAPPNAEVLLADEKVRVKAELGQVRDSLARTRDIWRQRLQPLLDPHRLDHYRQRAQALRQGSAVARVAAGEQWRRDIQIDLDTLSAQREQARADWSQAQTQLDNAKRLPQRELDRVLASAGLNQRAAGFSEQPALTQALVGGEFAPLVEQLKGLGGLSQPPVASVGADGERAWRVLARTVNLDGQFEIGNQPLRFIGVIHNVTPQPQFWNVATDFAVHGAADQPGKFDVSGMLDQRKAVSVNVRLALHDFPVEQLPLSAAEVLNIAVEKSLLDVDGLLRMEGSEIDIGLFGVFRQAQLAISAGNNPIAQTLASALRTINQFDLNVLMTGDIRAPRVQLRSSLDQILAAAVGDEVRAQTAALAQTLQMHLLREIQPELDAINQLGNDIQDMQQALLKQQDALQNLINMQNPI